MADSENLVFCGTPQFAVPTLEKLIEAGFNVRLVLTQPDRPKGRGLGLVASPVKQTAERLRLPIYQPEKIKQNEELRAKLYEIAPAPILNKEDGRIDFSRTAQEIYNRLRGFQPWPGAFTIFRGKTLNITAAKLSAEKVPQAQLLVKDEKLFAGCGNSTALELLEVQ